MKNIIEVKDLTKFYKELKALNNFSLEVKKGEILGLLGPNGSGKSTLISCMLSLLNYEKGTIKIFGKEMTPSSYDIKQKIGVIFQDVAIFSELTVFENINYFCGLYIKDKQERLNCVKDAINLTGLNDFEKFFPKQLSGGLLRRLNIACGIAHKPELIFLDEPTVAVDPQSRNHILEGIKKLNQNGATIVYTTHYMEEVEILCNNIVILDKGVVIAKGTKEELKDMIDIEEKITIDLEEEKDISNDITAFKNVKEVIISGKSITISYKKGKNNLEDLIDYLKINKVKYNRIFSELPTLNDVFLELTGKELRD